MEPVRLGRPLRGGREGRLRGIGHLARRPRAPARDAQPARDERSSTTTGSGTSSSSSSWTGSSTRATSAARASDETRELLFEAAAALGAHHIKVGNIPGTPCELEQVTERFAELCADAAEHTDAKIAYEFMPFDSTSGRSTTVIAVVGGAGAPNGGIAIDTWHMGKLGIAPEELRRDPARVPVAGSSSATGSCEDMADPVDEAINHRRLPGEGEFDMRGYVDACRDIGYAGPWGVEVLSEELRNLPIEEIFQRAVRDDQRPVPRRSPRRGRRVTRRTPDRDRLVWMFTQMLRIREFEERVKRTFEEHPGVIRGHTHLADGAEASIVGSLAAIARRRPAAGDLPLPRLPDRAGHRRRRR